MSRAASPSPSNYTILKGELYFRPTGTSGWQHMGNAPAFTYTPTVEKKQHYSSMAGVQALDDETTVQIGADIAVTLDEITATNLRMALLGTVSSYTQSALTATEFTIADVEVGKSYDLGKVNLTSVTVEDETSPTPVAYTAGTHYTIDLVAGIITILAKPATAGDDCIIAMTADAIVEADGFKNVAMMQDLDLEGGFMCIGKNTKGNRLKVTLGRVSLQPSGGVPFISEDYAQLELSGKALADATDSTYPYGRVLELTGLE